MPATLDAPMAPKAKTKTVRMPADLANMLQTIDTLKAEMGEEFSTVGFLTKELGKTIRDLHAETVEKHQSWYKQTRKSRG